VDVPLAIEIARRGEGEAGVHWGHLHLHLLLLQCIVFEYLPPYKPRTTPGLEGRKPSAVLHLHAGLAAVMYLHSTEHGARKYVHRGKCCPSPRHRSGILLACVDPNPHWKKKKVMCRNFLHVWKFTSTPVTVHFLSCATTPPTCLALYDWSELISRFGF